MNIFLISHLNKYTVAKNTQFFIDYLHKTNKLVILCTYISFNVNVSIIVKYWSTWRTEL